MSLPLDFALVQDVVLLLISGLACLYCALLNRRLKGLSNLKSGVGASIVSLTDAIKETHQAAKSTQASTLESIETLKDLLAQAAAASIKIEAETINLQRKIHTATKLETQLDEKIEATLPHAIKKAQNTASNLLKVVTDIEKYRVSVASNLIPEAHHIVPQAKSTTEPRTEDGPTLPKSVPHLTVVDMTAPEILTSTDSNQDIFISDIAPAEQSAQKRDPIDELFDDIDSLVKSKGVRKRLGFLKSREYHKS